MSLTVNIMLGNLKPHLWEANADSVSFVKGALEANCVTVMLGIEHLNPDAINLFFDRFYMEPDFPVKLKAAGVKYGLVCTEAISPDGVWNYGGEQVEPETAAAFELAARNAEFVWCQLAVSVEACRAMNPNSAQIRYGFLESMKSFDPVPAPDRDIDLLMCGMPSRRREKIMAALEERGHNTYYPGQPIPTYIRDALMARSRLNLSLQKSDRHEIVSVTRICHSVINGVPLLLETAASDADYAPYCLTTTGGTVLKDCQTHLAETDLEAWAQERYQQLADELPMAKMTADLLEQTVYQKA